MCRERAAGREEGVCNAVKGGGDLQEMPGEVGRGGRRKTREPCWKQKKPMCRRGQDQSGL